MADDFDDLLANDADHAAAIAALQARVDGHDKILARHEAHLAKLDETIAVIREHVSQAATKDDIAELREDLNEKYTGDLKYARESVPVKQSMVISAGLLLITALAWLFPHVR